MRKVRVEVYSRVSGYYRPISQWNKGKQAEFAERLKIKNPMEVQSDKLAEEKLVVSMPYRLRNINPLCTVV
jgi:hypothetical protein